MGSVRLESTHVHPDDHPLARQGHVVFADLLDDARVATPRIVRTLKIWSSDA